MAEGLSVFCLEIYVHRVEGLPPRLSRAPPSFAVQFLDYAPIVIAPPSDRFAKADSVWYGAGKRCVFEEAETVLRDKLRKSAATALLVLELAPGSDSRRELHGSATVALAGFTPRLDESHLGAVRTWGRAEHRVAVMNAYARSVGVVTLSVTLSSFDAALREALAPPPRPPSSRPPSSRQQDVRVSTPRLASPAPMAPSTSPVSPPTGPPPSVDDHCVDATLRMPESTVAAFDAQKRAALKRSLASVAQVAAEACDLLSWRQGSLIVDVRVRFASESGAKEAARRIAEAPPALVPADIFGPYEIKHVAAKRYAQEAARPESAASTRSRHSEFYEEQDDAASSGISFEVAGPLTSPPPTRPVQPVAEPQHHRTFEVFRGAACLEDDEDLGMVAPPLFHDPDEEQELPPPPLPVEEAVLPPPPPTKRQQLRARPVVPVAVATRRTHATTTTRAAAAAERRATARAPTAAPTHAASRQAARPQRPLAVSRDFDLQEPRSRPGTAAGQRAPPPPSHSPVVEEQLAAAFYAAAEPDGRTTMDRIRATASPSTLRLLPSDPNAEPSARLSFNDILQLAANNRH